MERLSLPRRNYQPVLEKDIPVPICRPELPKNPLPTWVTLPLDAKLPMIPGPKNNVLLYTTNLGEKRHKSTPELDFDLTDPYSQTMSNDYKPLHDPHLKPHLDTAHMRKRLRKGGFITGDGKVLCTLREYNEYRQYLRRINLALDRKRQTEEQKSRRRKKVARGGDAEGSHEWRVKQIKEKLQQQYERDKARYQRLMAEDEERREKLRESQKSRMSEKEKHLRQEQERRQMALRKRQKEENARKMEMLQRWYEEDEGRRSQTERRRRERDQLRERKLAESWEERRRIQQQTISQELRLRHLADEVKRTRLALRKRLMQQRRQRQQSIFEEMTRRQREEREKLEEECAQRIAERMERRRARAKNRRRKGKKASVRPVWKSNWDMTQLLLQEFSDTEEVPPRSLSTPPLGEHHIEGDMRKVASDQEIREQELTPKEQVEEGSELKIRDFKEFGADSNALSSLKIKEFLTDRGIPTAGRLTANMGQLIRENQTGPVAPADLAHVLVEVNNYIASKVIAPAYSKVKEEMAKKQQRSIRFNIDDTELFFIPYDDYEESSSEEDRLDMEMEDDDLESPSSRLAMAVDSLTRITKGPSASDEQSTLGSLANILCRLLEKLEHGEISPADAAKLARAAQDILGESPVVSDQSDTSLTSQSSSTASMMAAEMVQTSMAKVQYELLREYTPDELNDFYALPPCKATSSELTGMSKFVAETALAMAVESLMSFTDGIISDQVLGKTKVVRSEGDLPLGKSESSESMSCSSDFIMKILTRVLERVRSEADATLPSRPVEAKGPSTGPRSATSLYVHELLVKAVNSVQTAMASRPVQHLHSAAKSDTSFFVIDTLERVVQEIQRSRTPSATSLFVEELLCKITNETTVSDPNLSWDEAYNIHQRRSSASITSIFIRDTLSGVLAEIEKEIKGGSSVTSLFADEIVCSTLKKCESAVRQEMLPSRKLSELTAAILNSQQRNEDRNIELEKSGADVKPECTQSLGEFKSSAGSATECLAESLIRTTLEKAQESLDHGTISAEQVVQVLSRMSASTGQVAALDIEGEAVPASSCTSEQAESYISAAINKAVQEMASLTQVSFGDLNVEGECPPSAAEVSTFIQSILGNAIQELSMGLVDESHIGEMEMNLRYSLDALDRGTGDDVAEFTRIDDSASDSDFENNDMAIKQALASQAEAESLLANQNGSGIDRNNLARPQTQDGDSDEEDEVVLQPVYKGEPLHVDPQVARKALGAISVKNLEEMDDPAQALPRNSFRSLVCPDLSDVTGLDTSSSISLRSQLEKASKGTLPSQTRLRLAAASKMAQTGVPLETHTEERITKTKSLQAANKSPSRRGSDTSPYGSPGSSPKPSKTTVNRASLIASSAPSMKTVSNPTRSSTLSKIPLKEKSASPKSSKKSLSGRTSSRSVTNAASTSQSKLSPKKSSTTKSLADGKASVSSVKKQTSPLKQKSSNSVSHKSSTERRRSSESMKKKTSCPTAEKVTEDITPITADTNMPTVTTSDTAVPPAELHNEDVKETPVKEVNEQETKVPEKKSSQQLPRESGLIEMTTSSNPPSRKRSTASCQSKTSKTSMVTSPSASQRSVNLAPRPSSGFLKTLSGLSLTKNTSPTQVLTPGGSVGEVTQTQSEEELSAVKASVTKVK